MLTKLMSMITMMLGENYLLNYSGSCTGFLLNNAVQDAAIIIEGYQYCMSMNRAFDPLLSETCTAIHFVIFNNISSSC